MIYDRKFIGAGEVIIAKSPSVIWTVLGSCITVVFYSPMHKTAIFSHAQLPENNKQGVKCHTNCIHPCYTVDKSEPSLKYVSCSINYMIEMAAKENFIKNKTKVLLFGGASMFGFTMTTQTVGTQNYEMARKYLKDNGLHIDFEDVGGTQGRKIIFDTQFGEFTLTYTNA